MVCKCKRVIIESCSKDGKCKIKCAKCSQKGTGLIKINPELIKILKLIKRYKFGSGFINNVINKLPVELHLPGHNFTGPGTQLLQGKTRLNPDLTYKDWSKPINKVDEIAYRHDICFLENKDTKTRNEVCDKNMLNELNDIKNPTIRERFDRAIVKPLIWSKQKFGMGLDEFIKGFNEHGVDLNILREYFSPSINKKMQIYCVKCKKKTDTKNYHEETSKNDRKMGKGNCTICGTKKNTFLPSKNGSGVKKTSKRKKKS